MKILVLCYEYPPLGGGGGRVAQTVSRELASRGHEIEVHAGGMAHLPLVAQDGGVEVHRFRSGRKREDRCSIPEMMAWCAVAFAPTLRVIHEWQPDVIHAHFAMPTGSLAWSLNRLTNVPYVVTTHLGDVPGAFFPRDSVLFMALEPFAGRIWRDASRVTGVSTFVAETGERAYHRPVVMIPNGIRLDGLVKSRRSHDVPQLVFTGRLVEQKRPLLLLDALGQLRNLPWKLTLIGDGPLMGAVRERADALALKDRVQFAGWIGSDQVHTILGASDIFCMPSESEGLSVAAVEALKHGLAIAGTSIPGLRDVLTDGVNGRAVRVDDVEAYAGALRSMLTNRSLLERMQQASLQRVHEFDLGDVAAKYERVLEEAVNEHAARFPSS
jgi:glycosyltransferase involved in cell wall biosynthesis